MAGSITHYKIGKEIYENISSYVLKDIYLTSCQGHDLLYFVKLRNVSKLINNRKKARILQTSKFAETCDAFLDEVLKNPDDIVLKSFFYGYLTHHITDSIFHPFIHYYSGVKTKDKKTIKYNGRHAMMESVIDALIVPNIHDIYKEMPKIKQNKKLEENVEKIIHDVYGFDNVGKTMVHNMANVRGFIRTYRADKTKIKRIGYLLFMFITKAKVEFLSYHYPKAYLNYNLDEEKTWLHPVTGKKNISSINDLEKEAVVKITKIINTIEKELKNKRKAKIDLNISAQTGLKCDSKDKLQYFVD